MIVATIIFGTVGAADSDLPSDDEMDGINQIVEETEVMKMLKTQAERHDKELKELKDSIEAQLKCKIRQDCNPTLTRARLRPYDCNF